MPVKSCWEAAVNKWCKRGRCERQRSDVVGSACPRAQLLRCDVFSALACGCLVRRVQNEL